MIKHKVVDIVCWKQTINEFPGDVLDWAKENCPSYITNTGTVKEHKIVYSYYFSDEKDALLFSLRWS